MIDTTHPLDGVERSYDVVVVGARAAGASTAMLLARRGLSVLAVDRGAYGSDTLSTHSLARAGVLQISRWGLLDQVRAAGTPVARTVTFTYGTDEVVIEVPPRGDVDGLYSPRRTVLDRLLVDAAVAAGATVRHGVSVTGVTFDRGRAVGVELEAGGRRCLVESRVVVGADGVRSKVARAVDAPYLHRERHGAASIYAYWDRLPADVLPDDLIVNHYAAGGVAGLIPTNGAAAVVWTGLRPQRIGRSARRDLQRTYREQLARFPALSEHLADARQVSGLRFFPGTPGFLREAWGPGWALVGDAGYFKDPVSAHGITDALIGAELLADALVEVIAHGAPDDVALARYAHHRDRLAAEMMPAVAVAAGLPADLAAVQQAFVDMSRAMRSEWDLIETVMPAPAAC